MDKHSHSERHIKSLGDWMEFKKNSASTSNSISSKLNAVRNEEIVQNRNHVRLLFRATSFLGRQGLAFRGNPGDNDEKNKGNFIELLESYAEDNPILKEKLKKR